MKLSRFFWLALVPAVMMGVMSVRLAFTAGHPSGCVAALTAVILLALLVAIGLCLLAGEAERQRKEAIRKANFVCSISHELRTPLTNIRLYADLLSDGMQNAGEEKRKRYLAAIQQESRRLSRLVDNALDYGCIEQMRRSFKMERIDVGGVVRDALECLENQIAQAGMSVEAVNAEGADARADADRDALLRVLYNLVENATKYAASGRELRIEYDSVHLDVMDRGPGVSKADARHLFDRFSRIDVPPCAKAAGTGLGLAIAKSLMRGMRGDLTYHDRDGGGSIFRVEFSRSKGK